MRLSNRCTGEVLFSEPPSRGPASRDAQCQEARSGTGEGAEEVSPETLTPGAINAALAEVRGELYACVAKFKMRGTALLAFEVEGTGAPRAVNVEGTAAGTPLAACLAEVAMTVKFPPFRGQNQRFKYSVTLPR